MTPVEAAAVIGCSPQQVRYLIRTEKLSAIRLPIPGGFVYAIQKCEVLRYRDNPQHGGWPRGRRYSLV